jgi:hypothetical protein
MTEFTDEEKRFSSEVKVKYSKCLRRHKGIPEGIPIRKTYHWV